MWMDSTITSRVDRIMHQRRLTTKQTGIQLVLTHHWYDEIESGKKTVEYREHTDFWHKRIINKWKRIEGATNIVVFHRGYSAETMKFEVDCLILRYGVIELHLGERII